MKAPRERIGTYRYGLRAELLAAWYLRLRGYRILSMRYKTPVGEVDIIAARKNLLVFAEVKARRSQCEGLEAVTPRARQRISRAASFYLARDCRMADPQVRFDVLVFSPPFFIRHLDNAWQSVS